jgi:hypothetical protein
LAFFLFVAFFRLGAFLAAPLEAAALARLRFIFMSFKPPVPTKRPRFYGSRNRKSNGIAQKRGSSIVFCAKSGENGLARGISHVATVKFPGESAAQTSCESRAASV